MLMRLPTRRPMDTAGLRWAPETSAMMYLLIVDEVKFYLYSEHNSRLGTTAVGILLARRPVRLHFLW